MASSLDEELAGELERREAAGLLRALATSAQAGDVARAELDFVSNDYLGLARHPRVVAAARLALDEHGAGGRASRLLGGGSPLHEKAERAAAEWLGAEAALLFPSGYQANIGLIGALAGRGDALFSDAANHASLIDGARLSGARVFVHAHLDLEELERLLERAREARRRIVLTEGVFSMDGDAAALAELDELCARHDAWLVVDEAHAAGLLGPQGAGAWAALERSGPARLAARVVTGGKALGAGGAFVAGSARLVQTLVNRARSFVFTTAPPPALAGALLAAIEECRRADAERARTLGLARELARRLGAREPAGAIVPYPAGEPARALELAATLRARGFAVAAVRPPSVPEGGSLLRLVCHATNSESALDELARFLVEQGPPPRPRALPEDAARVLFVAGTDTGVGKTLVAALLLRAARSAGKAAYWKPVQTGTESDTRTVGTLTDARPHELLPPAWTLELPASPHEAARHAGTEIDPARLEKGLEGLRRALLGTQLVVELAGGLLVPYRSAPRTATQADWLERAHLPLVLVARSGLGTLNHTLLSLEALRARHLEPRALFLVGEPHASNRATLAELGGVPIFEVPPLAPLSNATLDGWLARNDLTPCFGP